MCYELINPCLIYAVILHGNDMDQNLQKLLKQLNKFIKQSYETIQD